MFLFIFSLSLSLSFFLFQLVSSSQNPCPQTVSNSFSKNFPLVLFFNLLFDCIRFHHHHKVLSTSPSLSFCHLNLLLSSAAAVPPSSVSTYVDNVCHLSAKPPRKTSPLPWLPPIKSPNLNCSKSSPNCTN